MEKIKTITTDHKNYPTRLKEIKNPPEQLYIKGKIFPEEKCFAVVGTRRYSSYGKQAASEIAAGLAQAGLTIVSGLAPGIDTFAHRAAAQAEKRTIAVLGTGIDEESIYPKRNLNLAEEIVKTGGAVISEYEPGTRGTKFTFPKRNRIISGLSIGVIVIEAKQKSGALITANWARNQNRKLFALPGSIHALNSKGCHKLIREGAKLAENANHILNDLGMQQERSSKEIKPANKTQKLIIELLVEQPLTVNKIIKETNLPAGKVASALTEMEIENKVRKLSGNKYALKT